jgi:hypothetical protein
MISTAAMAGTVTFTTQGSDYDTLLAVYEQAPTASCSPSPPTTTSTGR